VRANADAIAPHLNRTPVMRWPSDALALPLPATTRLWLKLEHLQAAGSF
jgi:threonine dehydratase